MSGPKKSQVIDKGLTTSPFRAPHDLDSPLPRVSNNGVTGNITQMVRDSSAPSSSLSNLSSMSKPGGSMTSGSSVSSSFSSLSSSSQYATKNDLAQIMAAIAELKVQSANNQLPHVPSDGESKQPRNIGIMADLKAAISGSQPLKSAIRSGTSDHGIKRSSGANTVTTADINADNMNDGIIPNPDDYDNTEDIDVPEDDNNDITGHVEQQQLTSVAQYRNVIKNYQGLFMNWYRMNNIRDGKADREVRTICMAIDALIQEGCQPGHSQGLEILCSRLAGLIIINEGKIKNAYQVADHLEYKPIDVMIPYANLTRAVKTSKLYEKVGGSPSGTSHWGSGMKKKSGDHLNKVVLRTRVDQRRDPHHLTNEQVVQAHQLVLHPLAHHHNITIKGIGIIPITRSITSLSNTIPIPSMYTTL